MTTRLRYLYFGAAILAVTAVFMGTYDYFVVANESRSIVGDVLVPLGALIVIVILYRRRRADLEGDLPAP